MKNILQVELRRAFTGKGMVTALIIGGIISIVHIFHNVLPVVSSLDMVQHYLDKGAIIYPIQVFETWICGNTYNLEGFLYFMILPLLAVLPYAGSFHNDYSQGMLTQVYTRTKRKDYLTAKYISVFLSAGVAVVLPLVLNLAVTSMMLPSLKPQNSIGTFINTSVIGYQIYENTPYLYIFLFLCVDFIFAGLMGGIALSASFYTEKKIVVLTAPMILYIFIYSVCNMVGIPTAMAYAPTYFLFAGYGCVALWVWLVFGIFYLISGGFLFFYNGMKEELL